MRLKTKTKTLNLWEKERQIPLGVIVNSPMNRITHMQTHSLAETTLVFSKPGVGKSVITKNIYAMNWMFGLPQVIFDPTGADHRLNYLPNSRPINLAPGVDSFGMSKHPRTGREVKYLAVPQPGIKSWETIYRPNLNDFNSGEFESMGFSAGASAHLERVLRVYGPFKSFESLVSFIDTFPSTPREADSIKRRIERGLYVTDHTEEYRDHDTIPSSSKENLQKILYQLKSNNLIALNDEDSFDVVEWVDNGNSVVFSFDENYSLARVVVSLVCRRLIVWKKTWGRYKDLGLGFEEMDKTFPKEGGEGGMSEFISNLVLKLRKLSIKIVGSSATLKGMDENLLENCHNVIFGPLAGRHLGIIKWVVGSDIADMVSRLRWNRFAPGGGYREFLLVDERKNVFKFNPFECPCEMHREITRKGFYDYGGEKKNA